MAKLNETTINDSVSVVKSDNLQKVELTSDNILQYNRETSNDNWESSSFLKTINSEPIIIPSEYTYITSKNDLIPGVKYRLHVPAGSIMYMVYGALYGVSYSNLHAGNRTPLVSSTNITGSDTISEIQCGYISGGTYNGTTGIKYGFSIDATHVYDLSVTDTEDFDVDFILYDETNGYVPSFNNYILCRKNNIKIPIIKSNSTSSGASTLSGLSIDSTNYYGFTPPSSYKQIVNTSLNPATNVLTYYSSSTAVATSSNSLNQGKYLLPGMYRFYFSSSSSATYGLPSTIVNTYGGYITLENTGYSTYNSYNYIDQTLYFHEATTDRATYGHRKFRRWALWSSNNTYSFGIWKEVPYYDAGLLYVKNYVNGTATVTLKENTYNYIYGVSNNLGNTHNITIAFETRDNMDAATIQPEYAGYFKTNSVPTITFPSTINWVGGMPTLSAHKTYEFSIVGSIGVMVEI